MRFNQLSRKAKETAITKYLEGWNETHSHETGDDALTRDDVRECLSTDLLEEIDYNEMGLTSYDS
jgi:hypothetical protein